MIRDSSKIPAYKVVKTLSRLSSFAIVILLTRPLYAIALALGTKGVYQ
jgi:hypothetical protein